jgi:NAD+ kinase
MTDQSAVRGESRAVLLVTHTGREPAPAVAADLVGRLRAADVQVRVPVEEAADLGIAGMTVVAADERAADGCSLVVVIGGDGTILRGAELARHAGVPLLGVNLGRVGFLAEAEPSDLAAVADHIIRGAFSVEERMAIDVVVSLDGVVLHRDWALNEISVEKDARERMLEVELEVDRRPVSRWGCDGVVVATPTGSTAYAFSAGGPVVWPEVAAMLVVPLSAHALFARPLVVSPAALISVALRPGPQRGVMWADGRRSMVLPEGALVEVRASDEPVAFARLHRTPFSERLVAKFALPVAGWRGDPPT